MSDVELIALWETLCKMDSKAPIHIGEIVCSPGDLLDVIERAFVQQTYSQVARGRFSGSTRQTVS